MNILAHLGNYFIVGAAAACLSSMVLYIMVWRGNDHLRNLARSFFSIGSAFIIASLVTLLVLIFKHDFSVAYVFSYSSTDLPWYYLMSSLWGGQEGTFLLWIFYAGIFGMVLMRTAGSFEKGTMVFVNMFMLSILIILLRKSPFELMPVFRAEGAGLNPLLQNYWMTIHPPIMFVGFAGVVIPAAFAFTALIGRRYVKWAEAARRWTLFAWGALGVSLVMGGYWAYETLGWGGFWAWDPVENSSFIPWIFLTAQVHTLFIRRQRRGLLRFSLFVTILSFLSVIYGTFLTRSGVLADFSVHSFVDLGINNFLIGGLLFFLAMGLFLLIYRWNDISPEPSYSTVKSRSYIVTLGIVVMFIGGVLVLLGTSAPLLTRMTENPSAVGLSYYFTTMTPVAIAIMLLVALFPAFKWNKGISRPKMLMASGSAAVITIAALLITGATYELIYLAFFAVAAAAFVSNGWVVMRSWSDGKLSWGYVSHLGLALAMVGAAVSAGFETKETMKLPQDQTLQRMGYELTFADVENTEKGFDCHVTIDDGSSRFTAVLPHEFPKNSEGVMKKPHVEKFFGYDLYVAPVAIEQPEQEDPGIIILGKGESATIDKYTFTFHDFEMTGHEENTATSVGARLTLEYEETSEEVEPRLSIQGDQVKDEPVSFDQSAGSVMIAGIRPDDGAVVLQVSGAFVPAPGTQTASLVIELSEKPLINLFWLGTIIIFFSGAMSMRERRRRELAEITEVREDLPPSESSVHKSAVS